MGLFWKIKRWWNYWFGKEPKQNQYGQCFEISEAQIRKQLFENHIEVTDFEIRHKQSGPRSISYDPLDEVSTYGWRVTVIEHTRKSWRDFKKCQALP